MRSDRVANARHTIHVWHGQRSEMRLFEFNVCEFDSRNKATALEYLKKYWLSRAFVWVCVCVCGMEWNRFQIIHAHRLKYTDTFEPCNSEFVLFVLIRMLPLFLSHCFFLLPFYRFHLVCVERVSSNCTQSTLFVKHRQNSMRQRQLNNQTADQKKSLALKFGGLRTNSVLQRNWISLRLSIVLIVFSDVCLIGNWCTVCVSGSVGWTKFGG